MHCYSLCICFVLPLTFSLISSLFSLAVLFPLFLLHTVSCLLLNPNTPLCCLSLPVPFLLFPAFILHPHTSSLSQVVKWILLSHQGKSRKRRRIEPKRNYKEVGGTQFYYQLLCSFPLCYFELLKDHVFGNFYVHVYTGLLLGNSDCNSWAEHCLSDNHPSFVFVLYFMCLPTHTIFYLFKSAFVFHRYPRI